MNIIPFPRSHRAGLSAWVEQGGGEGATMVWVPDANPTPLAPPATLEDALQRYSESNFDYGSTAKMARLLAAPLHLTEQQLIDAVPVFGDFHRQQFNSGYTEASNYVLIAVQDVADALTKAGGNGPAYIALNAANITNGAAQAQARWQATQKSSGGLFGALLQIAAIAATIYSGGAALGLWNAVTLTTVAGVGVTPSMAVSLARLGDAVANGQDATGALVGLATQVYSAVPSGSDFVGDIPTTADTGTSVYIDAANTAPVDVSQSVDVPTDQSTQYTGDLPLATDVGAGQGAYIGDASQYAADVSQYGQAFVDEAQRAGMDAAHYQAYIYSTEYGPTFAQDAANAGMDPAHYAAYVNSVQAAQDAANAAAQEAANAAAQEASDVATYGQSIVDGAKAAGMDPAHYQAYVYSTEYGPTFFKDAANAGMDPAHYASYVDSVQSAQDAAKAAADAEYAKAFDEFGNAYEQGAAASSVQNAVLQEASGAIPAGTVLATLGAADALAAATQAASQGLITAAQATAIAAGVAAAGAMPGSSGTAATPPASGGGLTPGQIIGAATTGAGILTKVLTNSGGGQLPPGAVRVNPQGIPVDVFGNPVGRNDLMNPLLVKTPVDGVLGNLSPMVRQLAIPAAIIGVAYIASRGGSSHRSARAHRVRRARTMKH